MNHTKTLFFGIGNISPSKVLEFYIVCMTHTETLFAGIGNIIPLIVHKLYLLVLVTQVLEKFLNFALWI